MRTQSAEDAAVELRGWWLDIEALVWDHTAATLRAPVESPSVRTRWGVGIAKAPSSYRHVLVIREVVEVSVRHSDEYPWAQPIEDLSVVEPEGVLLLGLGFGTAVRLHVRDVDIEVTVVPPEPAESRAAS